jgi:hypothetical protein
MSKATRDSRRVAASTRAQTKSNHCPVEAIAGQIEGLWVKHDEIEAAAPEKMTKADSEVLMRELFGASETLKDLAGFTRAQTLAGALFQIGLASDCADDLRCNKLSEDQQTELGARIERLLYSAAGVIRRELAGAAEDLSTRYMPVGQDPLIVFDEALRRP